ncbi:MAG TPA: hypothetical protein PLN37_08415, partial [Smithella sp.]|nr:hypothetical protein [Smithella sp.]
MPSPGRLCDAHPVHFTPRVPAALPLSVFQQHCLLKNVALLFILARPVGFEPTTNRFEVCDS